MEIGVETDVKTGVEISIETSVWWVWWCWHGGRFLGLVILFFDSHRGCDGCLDWLVGFLWVCWVFSGYLVLFLFCFFVFCFFFFFGFSVLGGFCWARGSGGHVGGTKWVIINKK